MFSAELRTSIWIPLRGDPGGSRLLCIQDIVGFLGGRFVYSMCAGRIHMAKAESFQSPRHGTLLFKRTSGAISWALSQVTSSSRGHQCLEGSYARNRANKIKQDHRRSNKITAVYHSLSCLFSKSRQVWKVQRRLGRLQSAPQGATPQRAKRCKMM